MFCPYCGTSLDDDAIFCGECGKNIAPQQTYAPAPVQNPYVLNQQAQQYQAQKNAIRQSETTLLQNVIQHFSKKQEQYDAYDEACAQVNRFARGARNALLIWGAIISTFGMLFCFPMFAAGTDDAMGVAFIFFLIFCVPGFAMIAGGILMKINNRRKLAHYQQEYANLALELSNHYQAYPNCPVGPEYSNPRILWAILRILQSGRADTIRDSLNTMIADTNQRVLDRYLHQIQQDTAAINAQSRVATIFMAARFFR